MDYVTNLEFITEDISVDLEEEIPKLKCKATYQSGNSKIIEVDPTGNNFKIEKCDILEVKDGKIIQIQEGTTELYYYLDGVCAAMKINVREGTSSITSSKWFLESLSKIFQILVGGTF